ALAYAYANTDMFQAHLEQVSSRNFDEFFKDWFEGQGYPTYDLLWRNEANNQVVVKLDQSTSHASVSFFEMPVQIQFKSATQDTILTFEHTFDGQEFVADLSFSATEAVFDPNRWVLARHRISNIKDV